VPSFVNPFTDDFSGGKLIRLEVTQPELMRSGFVFGILKGWWLSELTFFFPTVLTRTNPTGGEKFRKRGPCVSEKIWDTVLRQNGFSGNDFVLHDYEDSKCHEFSIIVSTATKETVPLGSDERILIVTEPNSLLQQEVAQIIHAELRSNNKPTVEIIPLADVLSIKDPTSAFFIFLPELKKPFPYELGPSTIELLKEIGTRAQRLLWVTHGTKTMETSPKVRMIDGLARVLRSETNSRTFVIIDFEDPQIDKESWAKMIVKVLIETISTAVQRNEVEYVERNGTLLTNRVVETKDLEYELHAKVCPQVKETKIQEAGRIALTIGKPGLLDSLYFISDDGFSTELAADEIEIEDQYLGLNFRDLLVALGRYDDKFFGCECAGVVTRVGNKCEDFKKGGRVCVAKIGCMNTCVRSHKDLAFNIPDELPSMEAAGLVIAGSSVYYSLVQTAKLQRGESILIHSASGPSDQMAIQLAQHLCCEIFVTVGFDNKRALVMEQYKIPEDHIFYSSNLSFSAGIMRMTNDRGVDVVLNSLSGDALVASWEVIAPYGRFVELGKVDISGNSKLPIASFAKNVSFTAVAVDNLILEQPKVFRIAMLSVMDLLKHKILRSVQPLNVIPISTLQEGMRLMPSGKMSGKVVFSINPADLVPVSY
jgi:NADPH:quinone reductase-like Zn-dependent oxidoreductase